MSPPRRTFSSGSVESAGVDSCSTLIMSGLETVIGQTSGVHSHSFSQDSHGKKVRSICPWLQPDLTSWPCAVARRSDLAQVQSPVYTKRFGMRRGELICNYLQCAGSKTLPGYTNATRRDGVSFP